MSLIYHITTQKEWEQGQAKGHYEAASLALEGFIHCSLESQVAGVLERYYRGIGHVVKLEIETERLRYPLKYENAPSINERFPHIYGPLNIDAVVGTEVIDA